MVDTPEVPLPEMPSVPTLNDWYDARSKEPGFDPATFPRVHAEVIEWPCSPSAHRKALAEQASER